MLLENLKAKIKQTIEEKYNVNNVIVEDGKIDNVDISVPLFSISKTLRVSPKVIFDELIEVINFEEIGSINFLNGFLNININRSFIANKVINAVLNKKEQYGNSEINNKEVIVIDYSSPNIAKSFGVGHLRSTVIGNAIKNLYLKTGAKVIGVNHLGDWGTQFGKMIVSYKLWGKKEDILRDPITELQKLYVKFHEEEVSNPELEQAGRDAFKKLEENDPEMVELWQWFRTESLQEFIKVYERLNVTFDSYNGEAFYNDKMDTIVELLDQKGLLKIDEGATIVDLSHEELPPALIKRSDGATLYMTRDLAALKYRVDTYNLTKALYVVGNEQKLHFNQLKSIAKLMGYDFEIEHIGFGLVMIDGKKMSTRGGKFKRLEDVLDQAVSEAYEAIVEKNPNLENKNEVAEAVGIGAIIFNDLKNERNLNIDFDIKNMIKFEGQTGPYLQYSSVRIASILKDKEYDLEHFESRYFEEDHYFNLLKKIDQFPQIISRAAESYQPSVLAKYLLSLAQDFNHFYGKQRILVDDLAQVNTNLSLIAAVRIILNEGMRILGIKSLNEM